ncbi:MAG TPA: hypothetical protein PLV53_09130 [Anaerolineaceae bacterium]|jgi:hypothetical protein|nr:hypothetical protein [Anaerolineaceae bacterium]
MVRAFLDQMLGEFGRSLLVFYETNSLWINLLVVLYGALIVLSWSNLKNIRRALILALAEKLRERPELASVKKAALEVPWEQVVGQVRYPFVARQTDLLPQRLSVEAVQNLLSVEDLTEEALKLVNPVPAREGKGKAK